MRENPKTFQAAVQSGDVDRQATLKEIAPN